MLFRVSRNPGLGFPSFLASVFVTGTIAPFRAKDDVTGFTLRELAGTAIYLKALSFQSGSNGAWAIQIGCLFHGRSLTITNHQIFALDLHILLLIHYGVYGDICTPNMKPPTP